MKHKDLAVIVGVALVSVIFSFIVSDAIFGTPQKKPIRVPIVQTISSDFPIVQNDADYKPFFNNKALDPTQLITSGGGNIKPFQGGH